LQNPNGSLKRNNCRHSRAGGDERYIGEGQKAAAKGYYKYTNQGEDRYSEYFNGIKFRVYVDKNTGVINNVHPE